MLYQKYPNEAAVNEYIKKKEPLIIVIPFDKKEPVLISMPDNSFEHRILLSHFGIDPSNIDRYFRIVVDKDSAKWTFACPSDYCGIADRKKRIICFYNDGFAAISKVLSEIGYFSDITIPRRYRRQFDTMGDDSHTHRKQQRKDIRRK